MLFHYQKISLGNPRIAEFRGVPAEFRGQYAYLRRIRQTWYDFAMDGPPLTVHAGRIDSNVVVSGEIGGTGENELLSRHRLVCHVPSGHSL